MAEIVEYNDDSSHIEVDVTSITESAESSNTQPSFTETSTIQPCLPIAHSSMADTSDSLMPSFDTSDFTSG